MVSELLNKFKDKEYLISSELELEEFAKGFSNALTPSTIVSLIGELGAGKTTFVRYLVKALGIDVSVSSPSYVLGNIYKGPEISVSHWDLYRLKECPIELLEEDYRNSVVLIEWANKFAEVEYITNITLNFEILENDKRKISIK